jgi:hypothetical protein
MEKRKRGGPQPGSGRPKGKKNAKTILQEEALAFMRKTIVKEWEPLLLAQMELAKGVTVRVDEKIYKKAPDNVALQYLFAMVVGKPKESVDIKHEGLSELTEVVAKLLEKK